MMITRATASTKAFANHLARTAGTPEATRAIGLCRATQLWGGTGRRDVPTPKRHETAGRVGIWEPRTASGRTYFTRSMSDSRSWHLWADVGRIEPKGAGYRILLLGESVARGYLYDPCFNPAAALRLMLASAAGNEAFEIVDLARTDIGLEIGDLAVAARALEPDAVVVFAGNNWCNYWTPEARGSSPLAELPRHALAAAMRGGGVPELNHLLETELLRLARRMVERVNAAFQECGTPVIWIVPEFNVGDWRDPDCSAPHLAAGNGEWSDCADEAERALEAGDLAAAASHADRMIALDGATSPRGFQLLAESRVRSGDRPAAREALERARDALAWDPSRHVSPRPLGPIQALLRAQAPHDVIDLPALFRDHLRGELPDRRLFLDYCHLTAEGMGIAMAAVARRILHHAGLPGHLSETAAANAVPSRTVRAEAAFLAAIHNGHYYQPYAVVSHFCAEALRLDPASARLAKLFIELQARRCPMLLCSAAADLMESASPLIQHYLLRYNHQQLDPVVVDAMSASLREAGCAVDARMSHVRTAERAVGGSPIDLLDPYYCGHERQDTMWATRSRLPGARPHFYRAYQRVSTFFCVARPGHDLALMFTGRLPDQAPRADPVALHINGRPCAEIALDGAWSTWRITVARAALVDGVNEIRVRWSIPVFPGQGGLDAAADALLTGQYPEFYPVFGEIHSLTAAC